MKEIVKAKTDYYFKDPPFVTNQFSGYIFQVMLLQSVMRHDWKLAES